jgi:hypothetical protein
MEYYMSQLIRYSRACGSYQDFLDRGLLLTRKLLQQGFLLARLKSLLRKFYGRHYWLGSPLYYICVTNDHRYVPLVVNTSRSSPHSWLITGFVTRLTWRVLLVEQELLILPEHLTSSQVFSGVRVIESLVLCVCFVDRCLPFWSFFFWPLCCLFFFDLPLILITPLVSSIVSYWCTFGVLVPILLFNIFILSVISKSCHAHWIRCLHIYCYAI